MHKVGLAPAYMVYLVGTHSVPPPSCNLLRDYFISIQVVLDTVSFVCYFQHQFP